MKKILIFAVAVLMLSACNTEEKRLKAERDSFASNSDVGFYDKSTPLFTYDSSVYQLYWNARGYTFRAVQDQDHYFEVDFALSPLSNASQKVTVRAVGLDGIATVEMTDAKILKTEGNKVWFWSDSAHKGGVIVTQNSL